MPERRRTPRAGMVFVGVAAISGHAGERLLQGLITRRLADVGAPAAFIEGVAPEFALFLAFSIMLALSMRTVMEVRVAWGVILARDASPAIAIDIVASNLAAAGGRLACALPAILR